MAARSVPSGAKSRVASGGAARALAANEASKAPMAIGWRICWNLFAKPKATGLNSPTSTAEHAPRQPPGFAQLDPRCDAQEFLAVWAQHGDREIAALEVAWVAGEGIADRCGLLAPGLDPGLAQRDVFGIGREHRDILGEPHPVFRPVGTHAVR